MFENQQREEVEALMRADANFRRLYQQHQKLDNKVHEAVIGRLPIDDVTLGTLKREKLRAKDQLQHIWDEMHAGRAQAQAQH